MLSFLLVFKKGSIVESYDMGALLQRQIDTFDVRRLSFAPNVTVHEPRRAMARSGSIASMNTSALLQIAYDSSSRLYLALL